MANDTKEKILAAALELFSKNGDAGTNSCMKSTCFNMTKAGYALHVISDCVTSYDLKKLPEMLACYADKGCEVKNDG